ncbi:MAG: MBL fold metallo-hydrolase [Thaumarchaeota archaeon]|nr:MBL fold metallo-hydrolase [Candidatus Calditenuaceae archaeon]MDW8186895.1 MBL fold metallo-hydrolase [Nitrososphaerota archaeon]
MEIMSNGRGAILTLDDSRSIALDSDDPNALACVSHAHMDHLSGFGSRSAITTEETKLILSARGFRLRNHMRLGFGESTDLGSGLKVSVHPSGHMLGSAVFEVEVDGMKVLYTGDLNTEPSILHDPAWSTDAEVLVIESTYGSPVYRFKERDLVYSEIVRWIREVLRDGRIPAFNVYAAGKAQEIIALVNQSIKVPVLVSRRVGSVASVYKRTYPWLDYVVEGSRSASEVLRDGCLVYVSDRVSQFEGLRLSWAVATGWALTRSFGEFDAAFPLSSHADFAGLIDYVNSVSPRVVVTMYGHSSVFASHLRRLGRRAFSLDEIRNVRML